MCIPVIRPVALAVMLTLGLTPAWAQEPQSTLPMDHSTPKWATARRRR